MTLPPHQPGGPVDACGSVVGSVASLARFPVKSTAGQALSSATVCARGLLHDREWAAYTADGGIASGKTTRRFRQVEGLMTWRSEVPDGGELPVLHSPTGEAYHVGPSASQALSQALGHTLTLRPETDTAHHDECDVHLVTTSSLRRVEQLLGAGIDARRTRVNIVLDTGHDAGFLEDGWTGADLAVGPDVVLRLGLGMPRCVMVDRPQASILAGAPMLRALGDAHDVLLGQQANVVRTGTISLGDTARLLSR